MLLAELLTLAGLAPTHTGADTAEIACITADSRAVRENVLFAAVLGAKHDGRDYLRDVVAQGGIAVIAPTGTIWPASVPELPLILVPEPRQTLARLAALFAGPNPSHMVAVTGTNGKTSTVDFLRQIWEHFNIRAASLGTLGLNSPNSCGGSGLTTPDPVYLAQTLAALTRDGVTHAAMEASSHGLDQHRLDGVTLHAAGFSNLTRDHLDYHQTLEVYRAAKLRLFSELLPERATAVVNADMDPETFSVLHEIAVRREHHWITVGEQGQDWRLLATRALPQGQEIDLVLHGATHHIALRIPGRFQADNILLAAALAEATGLREVLSALPHLRGVRGRLEFCAQLANGASAYVDYAHTPDALDRCLRALRPHTTGKLVCVFGAGGDRDSGKRPLMGAVVAQLADRAIITDDNPRTENAALIRAAIRVACPDALEIADREQAIAAGLDLLDPGDVLVVAGKGHELGQIVGREIQPFDDAAILRRLSNASTPSPN